jgi:GNAT superfamily N-acetyltransferase
VIAIERASAGDIAAVRAIDPRAADTPGRRAFLERAVRAGACWLARDNGAIAGFAVFDRSFFEQPFISLLFVMAERRREGIARALVEHIESICPAAKLFTSTNESNVAMQRFCDALGFVKSGYIDNLDEGDPEIVYFKRLEGRGP